jgi:amidase
MAGTDPEDSANAGDASLFDRDYTDYLDADALEGRRIGVVRSLAGFHEGVDEAFNRAIEDMKSRGAEIIDNLSLPDYPDGFQQAAYDVLLYEFKHDLNAYLAGLPGAAGQLDLEQLIAFNLSNKEREMKWFQQEIFILSQAKGGLDSPEYLEALARVGSFSRNGIDGLLEQHGLDALISPSNTPAWVIDLVVGDNWLGSSSSFPARAGYPHITVPMGYVHGIPVGISFYASAFSEPDLIALAYAYEQASKRARPPSGFGDWRAAVSD